jgi:diamine N-acetyltransferase
MAIVLREINMENFRECIQLHVRDDQRGFVAPNVYSLAEAKVDGVSIPLAIYNEDTMVGFIMYCFDQDDETGYIDRLMVDERYQGRGFGKSAMLKVIWRLRRIPGCKRIMTSFAHTNAVADALYNSLGFQRTGETTEDGRETIVMLNCKGEGKPDIGW